ncbi:MAG TPA: glycosyltransferase 87 family protein [Trebonia sp.]|nr:glycosyltransferase 87 family protein [Trebonia sp.]
MIWAVLVALFSSDSVHRLWGVMAACGYGLALLAILAIRNARVSDLALGVSFIGALLAPLAWMAAKGLEQPEVWVVARSGSMLIHQGTPYTSAAALAATTNPNAYNPYLPVMALFGLPRALFDGGLLTDPRIWFGVVFLAVFWLALRQAGARDPGRWTILVAGSPVIAFELAVGGTDVPMVGFLCLGFALLYRRPTSVTFAVLAGLALGIASAMKATAWPALVVAVVLILVRDGRKAAGAFIVAALAVVAVCVGPFVVHPKSLVDNTIKFPLGLASVRSAASSPLLGHVIAATWHTAGDTIVVALLVLAAAVVALSLVFRPPRSVSRAVVLLAGAMTLMFVLAPSTRFGYFIYPATLAIWLFAVRAGGPLRAGPATPDPDGPAARLSTSRPTIPAERPAA